MSGPLIGVCMLVVAMGLVMVFFSGQSMLDGDFTSTGSGRRGWITPPIAFLIGLGLALSLIAIVWQERTSALTASTTIEHWESILSLTSEHIDIQDVSRMDRSWVEQVQGETPRFVDLVPWDRLDSAVLERVPPRARPVVEHYAAHPQDRHELGTEQSLARAQRLSPR